MFNVAIAVGKSELTLYCIHIDSIATILAVWVVFLFVELICMYITNPLVLIIDTCNILFSLHDVTPENSNQLQ